MSKQTEQVIRKYAEYYLQTNREVLEPAEIAELEAALSVPNKDEQMIAECYMLIDKLSDCADNPGQPITITVGDTTAHLYDLAALVTSLSDALEYFVSELKK